MKLYELFLKETTEEDRALISLASAINDYINQNTDTSNKAVSIGTIGDLFDTPLPILNSISIILDTEQGILQRMKEENPDDVAENNEDVVGIWYSHNKTLVLDKDYIGSSEMKGIVAHELRHALDDFKSDFKANKPGTPTKKNSYLTPKNKEHRRTTNDPYFGDIGYLAQPAEINARFLQVLNQMVSTIRQASGLPKDRVRPIVMQEFKNALTHYQISDLFPEKDQSKDYKRLIKRGVDFIDKELAHKIPTK
jgi:hypothetical protein